MSDTRKIFVGSSSEALKMAKVVGKVIEDAHMEPVLWDTIFVASDYPLEVIERTLPEEVVGAILLLTPDVFSERGNRRFDAPVANVVFEYGYLAARLTRKRAAICLFKGATIPSDLKGLTVVKAGIYKKDHQLALPSEAKTSLRRWIEGLVPLAAGIPTMRRVHGYSGTWDVQNDFSLWHGIDIFKPNRVSWNGKTLVSLLDDGKEGYGSQIGQLKVKLGKYRATWNVANEVIRASVGKDGSLKMRVKVCARSLVDETGKAPDDRVHEELPSPEWDLVLEPVSGEPRKLEGPHTYKVAGRPYSIAMEYYTHADV